MSFPAVMVFSWLVFVFIMSLISISGADFKVADFIYGLEHYRWSLKNDVITQGVIHQGGKMLSLLFGVAVLLLLIISAVCKQCRYLCRPLLYLFLATLLSTLAVSLIKHIVSMECPWDLHRYGGTANFVGLLEQRPASMPDSACFPAGHASAGYAWIWLYFFFAVTRPEWRWRGLAVGLAIGCIFGVAQQLRGAHFLSHDLWTVMICWTVSFAMSRVMLPNNALRNDHSPVGNVL
jgi:membrane-associated PAP2 superfamily phosphatase